MLEYLILAVLVAVAAVLGFSSGINGMRNHLANLYGHFAHVLHDGTP